MEAKRGVQITGQACLLQWTSNCDSHNGMHNSRQDNSYVGNVPPTFQSYKAALQQLPLWLQVGSILVFIVFDGSCCGAHHCAHLDANRGQGIPRALVDQLGSQLAFLVVAVAALVSELTMGVLEAKAGSKPMLSGRDCNKICQLASAHGIYSLAHNACMRYKVVTSRIEGSLPADG